LSFGIVVWGQRLYDDASLLRSCPRIVNNSSSLSFPSASTSVVIGHPFRARLLPYLRCNLSCEPGIPFDSDRAHSLCVSPLPLCSLLPPQGSFPEILEVFFLAPPSHHAGGSALTLRGSAIRNRLIPRLITDQRCVWRCRRTSGRWRRGAMRWTRYGHGIGADFALLYTHNVAATARLSRGRHPRGPHMCQGLLTTTSTTRAAWTCKGCRHQVLSHAATH
jgi:hypothetical protein